MNKAQKQKVRGFFKKLPAVKLVYLYGSHARKSVGPMSDFDFAFYADVYDKATLNNLRFECIVGISRILKTDSVDVVCLNLLLQPEMKYAIISEGEVFVQKAGFHMLIEPRIVTEYCDFRLSLIKHGLSCSV